MTTKTTELFKGHMDNEIYRNHADAATIKAGVEAEEEHDDAVSGFITTLFDVLSIPENTDAIRWSTRGKSILIQDKSKFSSDVLAKYYFHDNIQNFIRQLNMYGFNKVQSDNDSTLEFKHPCFQQGKKALLNQIKRKSSVAHFQARLDTIRESKSHELDLQLASARKQLQLMLARQQNINSHIHSLQEQCQLLQTENQMLMNIQKIAKPSLNMANGVAASAHSSSATDDSPQPQQELSVYQHASIPSNEQSIYQDSLYSTLMQTSEDGIPDPNS